MLQCIFNELQLNDWKSGIQSCVDLLNWEIPVMVYICTIFYVVKTAKTVLGISYIIMI